MTIQCPTDGEVVVDVADVKAIVFDRAGHCEISFICPQCGAELRQEVTPVAMQMAIVEPSSADGAEGESAADPDAPETGEAAPPQAEVAEIDPARVEAYVEYFRRQLDHVADADAALEEIDG